MANVAANSPRRNSTFMLQFLEFQEWFLQCSFKDSEEQSLKPILPFTSVT